MADACEETVDLRQCVDYGALQGGALHEEETFPGQAQG
jgi:hypothetical protein